MSDRIEPPSVHGTRRDISGWNVIARDDRALAHRAAGIWSGKTIAHYAEDLIAKDPAKILVVEGDREFSVGELYRDARALAQSLMARGLQPGDVISFQLPNWHEAVVISLAAALAGFVINPLVPIYRDAELTHMLSDSRSRLVFVPAEFRAFDYPQMMSRVKDALGHDLDIVVVRGQADGALSYDTLLADAVDITPLPIVDAGSVKMVMYTSGTTGRPKGVLHTHDSLNAENWMRLTHLALSGDDVMLNPSPVTHVTGALYSLCLPFYAGLTTVLMDVWDPAVALEIMRTRKVTGMIAATIFLQGLVEQGKLASETLPSLRFFLCGGAQVPPDLIREAGALFSNCALSRLYGSTEVPCITAGVNDRAQLELGATTDGEIWHAQVRIVDSESGAPVPEGQSGEILAKGPQMFVGYTNADDNRNAFDDAGFFRMGDLGMITNGSFLTVTGRKKDLIIRAGENISPKEVEDILIAHPAIQDVAIVAMPDPRTGEAACAFVTLNPGGRITLKDIQEFLTERKIAKQKFPERLEIIEAFPRTSVGKIRKDILREMAKRLIESKP